MPRLPNNPDRDFSASQSEDDINADIAELFASRPLGIVELFVDPIVRMRIGSLITEAMTLTFHAFEVYNARRLYSRS